MGLEPVASASTRQRVVVAEDHADLREVFALAFELAGFDVLSAPDGLAALACVVETNPDVLVTDIAMPGMDGLDLITQLRLRESTKCLPILAISGQGYTDLVAKVAGCGGCDYLAKPCEPDYLVAKAQELIACRRGHSSRDESCPVRQLDGSASTAP